MEPFVLEPGKFLLTKLMESDRKIEHLFKKIEFATTLGGFSIEVRQLMPLSPPQFFVPCLRNSFLCLAVVLRYKCLFFFFSDISFSVRLKINPSCRVWKTCGVLSTRNP